MTTEQVELPELEESAHQVQPKAFWYRFKNAEGVEVAVTVVATCATTAKTGLKFQFGEDTTFHWIGTSDQIIQVNGEIIL